MESQIIPKCELQGSKCKYHAVTKHHSYFGANRVDKDWNKVPVCYMCHKMIHDPNHDEYEESKKLKEKAQNISNERKNEGHKRKT